jgi:hypothetical protein
MRGKETIPYFREILLVALLAFSFLLVYNVHYAYPYKYYDPNLLGFVGTKVEPYSFPIHADEWEHLAQAIYLIENGKLTTINPYMKNAGHIPMEPGFHAFVAQFFTLTGTDPITGFQYLPAVFAAISVLAIMLFSWTLLSNFYIGILSSLFFLAIRNNNDLTGIWFLLPLTFSIFLVYMFFYSFFKSYRLLAAFFYFASIFIYPLVTIIVTLLLAIYLASKRRLSLHYLFFPAAAILGIAVFFWDDFARIQRFLIFTASWADKYYLDYSLISIYGTMALLLAFIGIFFVFRKKIDKSLLALPAICLVLVASQYAFGFTVFMPYQRALYYLMLGLVPLSAIGTFFIFKEVYDFVEKSSKPLSIITIILFSLTLFAGLFYSYYAIGSEKHLIVHFVSQDDVAALKWLKANYGKGNTIMADIFVAYAVYPVSQNQITAVPFSNLGAGDVNSMEKFYNEADCKQKESALLQQNIKIVYSKIELNCKGFRKVYAKWPYLYEFSR